MDDLRLRIQQLLQQLNERVFGKEHVIALSLLSAVAGESIFLLGPPGGKEYGGTPAETGFPLGRGFRVFDVAFQYAR